MAGLHWPGEDAVGRRFKLGNASSESPWLSIVGVIADARHRELSSESRPEFYLPHQQRASAAMYVVARTTGDPTSLISVARRAVWDVDPVQPLFAERAMSVIVDQGLTASRATAEIMGLLSLIALALAVVEIYGVMSYSVGRRTREIGVRMALGAGRTDIFRLVARSGIGLVGIGIAVGLGGAFALTRFMTSLLYQVRPADPATFAVIAVVLSAIAALACYLPARRATRVNSMVALRYE